jgi:hypothetical protein
MFVQSYPRPWPEFRKLALALAGHVPDYKDKHGASFKRLTADRDLAAEGGLCGRNARKSITYKSVGLIAKGAALSAGAGGTD